MGLREEIRHEDIPHSRIYGNQRDIDIYRGMAVISSKPLHILLVSDGNPGYEIHVNKPSLT